MANSADWFAKKLGQQPQQQASYYGYQVAAGTPAGYY